MPRPKLYDGKPIMVRMDKGTRAGLEAIARKAKLPLSHVLLDLLRAALAALTATRARKGKAK